MQQNYEVTMAGKSLGTVQVHREGLYFNIHCRCQLSGDIMYQLMLCQQDRCENLGVLAPHGDTFTLEKRIPAKAWEQGGLQFYLKPRHAPMDRQFIPIRADTPVACLASLTRAVMARRTGQVGIVVRDEK